MARKKTTKAKKKTVGSKKNTKKKAAPTRNTMNARIMMSSSDDDPSLYVNFAEITKSKHEFSVGFARLPSKPSQSQLIEIKASKTLIIAPEIQLIMSPTFVPTLIAALERELEMYEEDHGKVK